jgi:hypothetical protein
MTPVPGTQPATHTYSSQVSRRPIRKEIIRNYANMALVLSARAEALPPDVLVAMGTKRRQLFLVVTGPHIPLGCRMQDADSRSPMSTTCLPAAGSVVTWKGTPSSGAARCPSELREVGGHQMGAPGHCSISEQLPTSPPGANEQNDDQKGQVLWGGPAAGIDPRRREQEVTAHPAGPSTRTVTGLREGESRTKVTQRMGRRGDSNPRPRGTCPGQAGRGDRPAHPPPPPTTAGIGPPPPSAIPRPGSASGGAETTPNPLHPSTCAPHLARRLRRLRHRRCSLPTSGPSRGEAPPPAPEPRPQHLLARSLQRGHEGRPASMRLRTAPASPPSPAAAMWRRIYGQRSATPTSLWKAPPGPQLPILGVDVQRRGRGGA